LGLTATATVSTVSSIANELMLDDVTNSVIKDTPLPDNLILSVSRDKNRDKALISLLNGNRFKNCSSIIIYCIRREECERVASLIRIAFQVLYITLIIILYLKETKLNLSICVYVNYINYSLIISHNI
jgi:ATP-dependent DNA helicase Q4